MTTGTLDPQIHDPARLRIVATLAALPASDALSISRLQAMLRLSPGSVLTGLRELDRAGYVRMGGAGGDGTQLTATLTRHGRDALDRYTDALRQLPGIAGAGRPALAPATRVGDADRGAAAAALGEHFAHGRLTFDELSARLDAVLVATTHGELSQVTGDLPDLGGFPARRTSRRGKRPRR